MDFTREPIIETVITPKEGCKIVVRSSKNVGQEEYFVDSLEVVTFGKAIFFRSLEKPKAFLVPASDYEILEVREARMVLKNVGLDRAIKIGGGRESKAIKEAPAEKLEAVDTEEALAGEDQAAGEMRTEKKRDRRRQQRRRRGRDEQVKEEVVLGEAVSTSESESLALTATNGESKLASEAAVTQSSTGGFVSALLPPPTTLISETIGRYKEQFKNAFYTKEEAEVDPMVELKDEDEQVEKELSEFVEEKTEQSISSHEEPAVPSYASFWDDINEPSIPLVSFQEVEEEPKNPSQEEPPIKSPEENKE